MPAALHFPTVCIDLLRQEVEEYYSAFRATPDLVDLRILVEVADLTIRSALRRKESRGLHYTLDYPELAPVAYHPRALTKGPRALPCPPFALVRGGLHAEKQDAPPEICIEGRARLLALSSAPAILAELVVQERCGGEMILIHVRRGQMADAG